MEFVTRASRKWGKTFAGIKLALCGGKRTLSVRHGIPAIESEGLK